MSWSLKKKLYAAFGALIGLVAILGALVFVRMREAGRLRLEQSRHQVIALDTQRLYTEMIQSRRFEKDFFARSDAKSLQRHEESRRKVEETIIELRNLLTAEEATLMRKLDTAASGFGRYQTSFAGAVAAFRRRGEPNSGLQGTFRKAAHEIEQIAESERDEELLVSLLQIRRAEKDYLLREEQKYVDVLRQYVADARKHIEDRTDTTGSTMRLAALLNEYAQAFDGVVEAMDQLAKEKQDLHEITNQNEAELEEVVRLAIEGSAAADAASAAVEQTSEFVLVAMFLLSLGIALVVARYIAGKITSGVSELTSGTREIGGGDLRVRVKVEANDELGELGGSFNQMVGGLRDMASNITTATSTMEEVVAELQATVAEQAAALQQQAASVSESVATAEELARSSEQVSDVAKRVLEHAGRSAETSGRGLDAIRQSIQGMNDVRDQVQSIATTILDLSERTQQIGTIIATVDDFAERSSLLALNASIEAARAGEAGKAFAVVAGEVKTLAEQSQQATERVRSILSEIQRTTHTAVMVTEEGTKRVDRGVDLATGAGDIIATLSTAISQAAESAKQIAAAARQQSNGIEQISSAMAGIEQFSRQNVQATKQTETTAHTLATVSKQLKATTAQYRV